MTVDGSYGRAHLQADHLVNCAGPCDDRIAAMLGVSLPVRNVLQQKIAFEDRARAVPRISPFSIDLDSPVIDWTGEERAVLREHPATASLTEEMPGGIHCRPDGGDGGTWLKLGWAYNTANDSASWMPELKGTFPEMVLRGAARLQPSLRTYLGRLPRSMHHYGGWYTMTEENWPLIGSMGPEGTFMNCAHSGFGTMVACAAGELCAATIAGAPLPDYADHLSLARYRDDTLMTTLRGANRGVL